MTPDELPEVKPARGGKRQYGTGSVFEKRNAWYGQWRVRNPDDHPQAQADPHAGRPRRAELVNAAFARGASINLSINLSKSAGNSTQETPAKTGEGN